MSEEENDEIKQVEQAAALYDRGRLDILEAYERALRAYAPTQTWFYGYVKALRCGMSEVPRAPACLIAFKQGVHETWHICRTKILNKIEDGKMHYAPLKKLDDHENAPKIKEYFECFDLLRDFIEELGILKIENVEWKYPLSKAGLRGFKPKIQWREK